MQTQQPCPGNAAMQEKHQYLYILQSPKILIIMWKLMVLNVGFPSFQNNCVPKHNTDRPCSSQDTTTSALQAMFDVSPNKDALL